MSRNIERLYELAGRMHQKANMPLFRAINEAMDRSLEAGVEAAELEFECEYPDLDKVQAFLKCGVIASLPVHAQMHVGDSVWCRPPTSGFRYIVAVPMEAGIHLAMHPFLQHARVDGVSSKFFLFTPSPLPSSSNTFETLSDALPENGNVRKQNNVVLLLTDRELRFCPHPRFYL